MKIKVCGLKDPENIKAVAALKPDYMGFINYGLTPRFIGNLPVNVLQGLPQSIQKTGVFVNDSLENIGGLIKEYGFDVVQLHGYENPEFCEVLKKRVTVIKAFGMEEDFNFAQLEPYVGHVDYFLFDTKTPKHGGSGKTFNWQILHKYTLDVPFFLSGGLSPDNIEQVLTIKHPQFYGVDLNSKFETSPGIKDLEKLSKAFELLRQSATNEI
ncbi:phosphoribosylanthranilate isomerase [Mucilaginibacter jinjuensis]|uniref:N-(5'-phosphoribosyl)anthranilate isomerase n=1 Tax=Mucilaginibacter jinjuensis TaxID=1176721 RepID=A0ABY7TEL4_9SPHI|nr:phosphoribosylanthranilate isomerase [Mucilaginibacter jinjuensis]WCT14969.1 phosphoribosylanthranilate isomerase [Mucilaginibacter jinjuensis]